MNFDASRRSIILPALALAAGIASSGTSAQRLGMKQPTPCRPAC
jgi:hypothetical protein